MKITIIGAGIIGVTSAYFLSKAGYEVHVLDRADGPALETSFANAGMLTPSMADPWNSPGVLTILLTTLGRSDSPFLLRPKAVPSLIGWGLSFLNNSRQHKYIANLHRSADLACYSLGILNELREDLNLQYEQRLTGSLKVFRDQDNMDKYAKLSEELDQHDMRFNVLASNELIDVEPSLIPISDKLCGGIYFPDDQSGNAYKFTCDMAKEAEKTGVVFHYGVTVNKLVVGDGKIISLDTNEGDISSDKFILCAGSFSSELVKGSGISVPVRPAKGYSISVPMNGWNKAPNMPIVDDGFHAAITPLGDILRVAGTAEFAGLDQSVQRGRIDNLYNFMGAILPEFASQVNKEEVTEWAGLRPLTVDGSPIIGKTPLDNLFVNTGHGPLGWTMAVGSAKMLCDIIKGETPKLNPSLYGLNRF